VRTGDDSRPVGGSHKYEVFHCIRGHDRTGIIALLLLALVVVTPDEIIADYELSPDPERDELLVRETAYMS
jgi:protein tyrosine/serine phosphatase